jgi:hypothetical protein
MIKLFILISFVLSAFNVNGQATPPFDTAKVSKNTELNKTYTGAISFVEELETLIAFYNGQIK